MFTFRNIVALSFLVVLISGCSIKGHEYKPDMNTVNDLMDRDLKQVNIAPIHKANNEVVPLRGAKMVSPYGRNFDDYLYFSLRKQLKLSNLYSKTSNIKIKTEFLKNEADIWGFSDGNYDLSSRFIIEKNEDEIYNKTFSIRHDFPSHFVGGIAVGNAIENYPKAVQKLIAKFLNDEEVMDILK